MGRVARLLSFLRLTRNDVNNSRVSTVKCDPGGGVNVTVEHYADAGDDSHPLPTDYVAIQPVAASGGEVALGYADTLNTPKAQLGDKRIYSRDSSGIMIADIWLKNDGTIIIDNGVGQFEMQPGGDIIMNGLTIDAGGNLTTPGTITGGGVELTLHTHSQAVDSAGDTQSATSTPL